MTQSLVGNLLVASTLVTESVFARGVCLMMHHDDDGAIAVMLNRPIWPPPAELIQMIVGEPKEKGESEPAVASRPRWEEDHPESLSQSPSSGTLSGLVHFGGPLSGPVLAIHGSMALAEAQTGTGIYVAAQKDHLEQLVREKPSDYRLIIGHAGWSAGQLDAEINAGMWHILPATADEIFGTDNDLWPLLIRRATGSTLARWVGAPDNPAAIALN
ncbi:MAG: YqgE/AlgH family protein [Planctomycetaceae bacterium]